MLEQPRGGVGLATGPRVGGGPAQDGPSGRGQRQGEVSSFGSAPVLGGPQRTVGQGSGLVPQDGMLSRSRRERALDHADHQQEVEVGADQVAHRGYEHPAAESGRLP